MNEHNPYLRYEGNGVFSYDFREVLPQFSPSLRARLHGAGKPIVRLNSVVETQERAESAARELLGYPAEGRPE